MRSLLLALLLAGCLHPVPPHPLPVLPEDVPACLSEQIIAPTTADVCDGKFVGAGWPCVQCMSVAGCFDPIMGIYCVKTDCSDPSCGRIYDKKRP